MLSRPKALFLSLLQSPLSPSTLNRTMVTTASSVTSSPLVLPSWPGATLDSRSKVRELIERNHKEHHIFEKNNIFHNHLSHHLLAAFSLGASPSLLSNIYDRESKTLVPLSPEERRKRGAKVKEIPEINEGNWKDFVGVPDAYASYLSFFQSEIGRLGEKEALEKYIFSSDANAGGVKNSEGPRMLIRLVAGVLHPFIQIGHGAEFSDPLLLAEGLAETAVHNANTIGSLFPDNWPHNSDRSDPLTGFSIISSTFGNLSTSFTPAKSQGLSALEVYSQLCSSSAISMKPYDAEAMINARLIDALDGANAEELRRLVSLWDLSTSSPDWETARSEELMLFGALLAGSTGRKGKEVVIDFFLMHVLTSSIFVHPILTLLPTAELKTVFLKTYLLAALHTALARGRPTIDLSIPMSHPSSPSKESGKEEGNPWCAVVEAVLFEDDSHTPKSIRTLLHLASLPKFALAAPGELPYTSPSSENGKAILGTKDVDGTVFVRIAGMIMELIAGWGSGRGERGGWGRFALGWDEGWKEMRDARK
ncbi:hypothetical protein BDY24DRAFT_402896 [Mrakia frigida]|uniref:questin oxidase family protein n=1 Tax=Mrakia frigida TaxID=29902 RepID=UPI003FCBFEE0